MHVQYAHCISPVRQMLCYFYIFFLSKQRTKIEKMSETKLMENYDVSKIGNYSVTQSVYEIDLQKEDYISSYFKTTKVSFDHGKLA